MCSSFIFSFSFPLYFSLSPNFSTLFGGARRAQKADAADMGAMTDTIGDRVLCDAECVAKLADATKVRERALIA